MGAAIGASAGTAPSKINGRRASPAGRGNAALEEIDASPAYFR